MNYINFFAQLTVKLRNGVKQKIPEPTKHTISAKCKEKKTTNKYFNQIKVSTKNG